MSTATSSTMPTAMPTDISYIYPFKGNPTGKRCWVFISHAGEQKYEFVAMLNEALQRLPALQGRVFVDDTSLQVGESNPVDTIYACLQDAFVVVVCLSKEYISKRYPMEELQLLMHCLLRGSSVQVLPVWYHITQGEAAEAVRYYRTVAATGNLEDAARDLPQDLSRVRTAAEAIAGDGRSDLLQQWVQDLQALMGIVGVRRDQAPKATEMRDKVVAAVLRLLEKFPDSQPGSNLMETPSNDEDTPREIETPDGLPDRPAGGPAPDVEAGRGYDDAAASRDALGLHTAAEGTASFLFNRRSKAMTLAVFGPWGRGKSTFMKLVESALLVKAAKRQWKAMGKTHEQWKAEKIAAKAEEEIAALASPQLLTVWFNAWQYLTEEEVWGGLLVEVTKRLEERLQWQHKQEMRRWWPKSWRLMKMFPLSLILAFQYNWHTRNCEVWTQLILPGVLAFLVVVLLMVYAVLSLAKIKASWIASLVTVLGGTGALGLGTIAAVMKTVKPISDVMLSSVNYFMLKDHSSRIGYQHEVIKDLQMLKKLLQGQMRAITRSSSRCNQPKRDINNTAGARQAGDTASAAVPGQSGNADDALSELQIVVFIDDLDRCKPTKVLEILEAINIALTGSGLSVVVGMDKDFILKAIRHDYQGDILDRNKAEEFLQKIVQVSLYLPSPAQEELKPYLESVLDIKIDARTTRTSLQHQEGPSTPQQPLSSPGLARTSDGANNNGGDTRTASDQAETTAETTKEQPQGTATAENPTAVTPGPPPPAAEQEQDNEEAEEEGKYNSLEEAFIRRLYHSKLLVGRSPREVKRLFNHYLLAKHILKAKRQKLDPVDSCRLLSWVWLWWHYPHAMWALLPRIQGVKGESFAERALFVLRKCEPWDGQGSAAKLEQAFPESVRHTQPALLKSQLKELHKELKALPTPNQMPQLSATSLLFTRLQLFHIPWGLVNAFKVFGQDAAEAVAIILQERQP